MAPMMNTGYFQKHIYVKFEASITNISGVTGINMEKDNIVNIGCLTTLV